MMVFKFCTDNVRAVDDKSILKRQNEPGTWLEYQQILKIARNIGRKSESKIFSYFFSEQ